MQKTTAQGSEEWIQTQILGETTQLFLSPTEIDLMWAKQISGYVTEGASRWDGAKPQLGNNSQIGLVQALRNTGWTT